MMRKASTDGTNVHMIETLSLSELTMFCDVNAEWVVTLVEHGVVTPVTQTAPEWEFTPPHIARARNPEMASSLPFAHTATTREADLQI